MVCGVTADELTGDTGSVQGCPDEPPGSPRLWGTDRRMRYCGIWRRPAAHDASISHTDLAETKVPYELAQHSDHTLVDLGVSAANPPLSTRERAARTRRAAEAALKAKPDDHDARVARATASYQLGDARKPSTTSMP